MYGEWWLKRFICRRKKQRLKDQFLSNKNSCVCKHSSLFTPFHIIFVAKHNSLDLQIKVKVDQKKEIHLYKEAKWRFQVSKSFQVAAFTIK